MSEQCSRCGRPLSGFSWSVLCSTCKHQDRVESNQKEALTEERRRTDALVAEENKRTLIEAHRLHAELQEQLETKVLKWWQDAQSLLAPSESLGKLAITLLSKLTNLADNDILETAMADQISAMQRSLTTTIEKLNSIKLEAANPKFIELSQQFVRELKVKSIVERVQGTADDVLGYQKRLELELDRQAKTGLFQRSNLVILDGNTYALQEAELYALSLEEGPEPLRALPMLKLLASVFSSRSDLPRRVVEAQRRSAECALARARNPEGTPPVAYLKTISDTLELHGRAMRDYPDVSTMVQENCCQILREFCQKILTEVGDLQSPSDADRVLVAIAADCAPENPIGQKLRDITPDAADILALAIASAHSHLDAAWKDFLSDLSHKLVESVSGPSETRYQLLDKIWWSHRVGHALSEARKGVSAFESSCLEARSERILETIQRELRSAWLTKPILGILIAGGVASLLVISNIVSFMSEGLGFLLFLILSGLSVVGAMAWLSRLQRRALPDFIQNGIPCLGSEETLGAVVSEWPSTKFSGIEINPQEETCRVSQAVSSSN